MMNYQDAEQKRRIKIIVIATIAAIVVLALGVWVVIAAINSIKGKNTTASTESTIVATDTKKTETEKTDEDKQKNNPNVNSPASQYSALDTTVTLPADTAPVSEDIPSTGPVDTALTALLAGVATYLVVTNIQLVKKQAAKRQAA